MTDGESSQKHCTKITGAMYHYHVAPSKCHNESNIYRGIGLAMLGQILDSLLDDVTPVSFEPQKMAQNHIATH